MHVTRSSERRATPRPGSDSIFQKEKKMSKDKEKIVIQKLIEKEQEKEQEKEHKDKAYQQYITGKKERK